MAGIEFEGDVDNFSESQLELIKKVLEEHGFDNNKVIIEPVGKKGDNYIALVKRIIVRNNETPFRMVAKVAPSNELIRQTSNTAPLFSNEIIVYSEVLPKFKDILDSESVPHNERFRMPMCYGFLAEPPNEIILLEDMNTSEFQLMDRFKSLDDACMRLALKDLAIFHSLSYVMKNKYPEIYEELKRKLFNLWAFFDQVDQIKFWLQQIEDDLIAILDNDKHKMLIKGSTRNLTSNAAKLYKYDIESKYSVLQQGDCWTNNILFRIEGEKPVESVMIDYQVCKAASPVDDLLYLTLNCTDHETRLKHQLEWFDYYHTQLGKSLDNFGLRLNIIYPRDQLDADLRMHGKLAFGLSIVLANTIARESDEALDIKDQALTEEINFEETAESLRIINASPKLIVRLKEKIAGAIETCLAFGYI